MVNSGKIRRRYRVYGRVQGVGFRYTAMRTASSHNLTGWVKNEYDGSVLMEVQGAPWYVKKFPHLVELESRWIRIDSRRTESKDLALVRNEKEFRML